MMDFRVGATPEVGSPADEVATPRGQFEARLLAIRPARGAESIPAAEDFMLGRQGGPHDGRDGGLFQEARVAGEHPPETVAVTIDFTATQTASSPNARLGGQ